MIEILSTTDPVRLSFLRSVLADANITSQVFDAAAPWPGAIPARLMVDDRDAWMARRMVQDAERDVAAGTSGADAR